MRATIFGPEFASTRAMFLRDDAVDYSAAETPSEQ
jgi:hypothetical protein